MRAPSNVRVAALVCALSAAATLSLAGCTGESESRPAAAPSPTSTGSAPALRAEAASYDVRYGKVAGHVAKPRRQSTLRALARPVRDWMAHGFVTGPWPRDGFREAFASFAGGTRAAATRDAGLLTLQRSGSSLTQVIPLRRRVRLSVTTHSARVVGATARVDLRLLTVDRSDHKERVAVRGDLYLTPVQGRGWAIYGYDLEQLRKTPGEAAGQKSDAGEERG